MDFKELVRMAQRRWLTIAIFFLLSVAAAAALTYSQTPQYESKARVFISADASGSSNDAVNASVFTIQRVQSYAELATSRELMQRVISRLDLDMTPAELSDKITSQVAANTVIIELTVRDSSPSVAQEIAKSESEALTEFLTELETPLGESASAVRATIVDQASYNGVQVSPQPVFNLVIAGFVGLMVGLGVALLREVLDNTVSSPENVRDTVGAPVLATMQFDSSVPKNPLVSDLDRHSARAEAFRLLRTNLQFLNLDTRPRALVITSAVPGEGKTSTATNLAITLAQAGQRVLLVEGDLRRPKVASLLGLERSVGMTTVLVGRSELTESIQKHSDSGIYFLASGPIPPNPTEVLQSRSAQELLDRLAGMFDLVIIDAPPLLPVSDAAILARDADGAILVVHHGKTTTEQLKQAVLRLTQVDANLFGATINMTPRGGKAGYGYGYGYGYAYEPQRSRRDKGRKGRSRDKARDKGRGRKKR